MIQETIITSIGNNGYVHLSPMGVHIEGEHFVIMPFKPSTTLDHILTTHSAVMNHTDDVRVFAGCLTDHRDWPLVDTIHISGKRLADCLAHQELELIEIEDDEQRPRLICKLVHQQNHKPFQGFNRAQHSVIEAAILISRLSMLPRDKIRSELDYLQIAIDKCAGDRELEAWDWLMEAVDHFRNNQLKQSSGTQT